jgi:hypothetical protein
MVWGAISMFKKFKLIRIEGTLDAEQYQAQILTKFVPEMPRATRKKLVLMQDGATAHTAASTQQWLSDHTVEQLPWWPANSPDMNPIENVWGWMEKNLKDRQCRTNDELWNAVQDAWDAIPMSQITSLFEKMPKRLKALRKSKGGNTKY